MKVSAPDPAVIEWLWSDEGISWAGKLYKGIGYTRGAFAEIKDDHECLSRCHLAGEIGSLYTDILINTEMDKYGISGVPSAWHRK